MEERPIIFNTENVKAILDGRKTQTRRVIKKHPLSGIEITPKHNLHELERGYNLLIPNCPYGQIRERLWVRETFQNSDAIVNGKTIIYKADEDEWGKKYVMWTSPLFMPRWASRITLEITEVRVEKLQEIENYPEDYKAEGYTPLMIGKSAIDGEPFEASADFAWFEELWDSINAKRGYGWENNPWVWVIKFIRQETLEGR